MNKHLVQLIAIPLNSKGSPSENSLNISLKTTPSASSNSLSESSLNNNIQSRKNKFEILSPSKEKLTRW